MWAQLALLEGLVGNRVKILYQYLINLNYKSLDYLNNKTRGIQQLYIQYEMIKESNQSQNKPHLRCKLVQVCAMS
jgi:hypothetical protein